MAKTGMEALLSELKKADGGVAMSIQEFKEAQYGIPLKHYCLQYLFGSTGLRYGGFYCLAGKPKSCKSPFAFFLCHLCCENNGISFTYELEGKASPTLLTSMFSDRPEWLEDGGTFRLLKGLSLDGAEIHMTKKVLKTFEKLKAYDTPLMIDWDSISGAAMSDVVKKIQDEGTAGKGFYDKAHVMKHLTENWSVLVGNLPVVFVGVLQEKEKAADVTRPGMAPQKSYGGGDSQLFKAGTLLSFALAGQLPTGNGKIVKIKTALNGFADARQIETKFIWDQFGDLETESQGHKWLWAESTARCLANPKVVGDLRDIIDVKLHDNNLVTCKNFGQDKVTPEEFEAALFAPENEKILKDLYKYQKIEVIKTPTEYAEFVDKLENKAENAKQAEKEAKKAEKEAAVKAAKEKEEAKKQKKEEKIKQQALAAAKTLIKGLTNKEGENNEKTL